MQTSMQRGKLDLIGGVGSLAVGGATFVGWISTAEWLWDKVGPPRGAAMPAWMNAMVVFGSIAAGVFLLARWDAKRRLRLVVKDVWVEPPGRSSPRRMSAWCVVDGAEHPCLRVVPCRVESIDAKLEIKGAVGTGFRKFPAALAPRPDGHRPGFRTAWDMTSTQESVFDQNGRGVVVLHGSVETNYGIIDARSVEFTTVGGQVAREDGVEP